MTSVFSGAFEAPWRTTCPGTPAQRRTECDYCSYQTSKPASHLLSDVPGVKPEFDPYTAQTVSTCALQLVVYLPVHLVPLPGPLQHLASEGPLAVNVKWALRRVLAAAAALVVLYSIAAHRNYERDSYK